jgi:DNA-binding response OmpR family regulator
MGGLHGSHVAEKTTGMQLSSLLYNQNQFSSGRAKAPIRLLVVDDGHETTQVLRSSLESGVFEVLEAHSGEQGLRQVRHAEPDMIVVDLVVAEAAGLEFCRELRRFSNSLVLLLSANGKPGVTEQAFNAGVDDYLTKPTNSGILVASVYKLARRAQPDMEPPRLPDS